jgi:protein SCO1/2
MIRRAYVASLVCAAFIAMAPGAARADTGAPRFDTGAINNGVNTTNYRPQVLNDVGIDQKLDSLLPLDAPFVDETGKAVKLGDYFGNRPVLLTIVQFSCQNLCTLELNGLCRAVNTCELDPGKDYDLVTISFDPRETTAAAAGKKRIYQSQINKPLVSSAWHFLTGSPDSIKRVTQAVGFRYVYDAAHDQYVHSAALMIATPDGHMSKYLYGAEFAPNDIRLSVAEAGQSKIGSLSDVMLLYCFHYDPVTGKYTLAVRNLLRAGGLVTLLSVGLFVTLQIARERRAGRVGH